MDAQRVSTSDGSAPTSSSRRTVSITWMPALPPPPTPSPDRPASVSTTTAIWAMAVRQSRGSSVPRGMNARMSVIFMCASGRARTRGAAACKSPGRPGLHCGGSAGVKLRADDAAPAAGEVRGEQHQDGGHQAGRELGADQVGAEAGDHRAERDHAAVEEEGADHPTAELLVGVLLDHGVVE